ncbi:heterokaryon incompatibility protein-domain-containing protein [Xylaria arbuscula]|nr:heterokaryon incompatibility protein-domain-containing protein [Xylaria arbuscula]
MVFGTSSYPPESQTMTEGNLDLVVAVGAFFPALDQERPCIRVLELQAGIDLDDTKGVGYETLSYCWGPLTEHQTIPVEGHRVEVTDNLYSALQRLRYADRNRLIWIDAVCINQNDQEEKEVQVNSCIVGVCWLGDFGKSANSVAPEQARGVVDFIQFLNDDCRGRCPPTLSTQSQRKSVGAALRIMMDAPWWHRIWTVQEVVLPAMSDLVWGPVSIPWKSMVYAQGLLTDSPGIAKDFFYPDTTTFFFTVPIYSLRMIVSESSTPIDLFYRFRSRSATDPRDKVYGLMGLMKKIGFERIQSADYSMDIVTLLKILGIELIQINNLKHWVGQSGAPHTLHGLPSWAVDFTREDLNQSIDGLYWWEHRLAYDTFDADDRKAANWLYNKGESKTYLILKGIKTDWIIHVIPPLITEPPHPAAMKNEQLADVDAQVQHWRIDLQAFIDDLATKVNVSDANRDKMLTSFNKACTGDFSDKSPDLDRVEKWKLEILRSKAIAITNEATVGLGPRMTQFGDRIHVVIGGRVPFVTREMRSLPENLNIVPTIKVGEQSVAIHTLVGNGYIDGVMYGEAFKGRTDDQLDWVVFR